MVGTFRFTLRKPILTLGVFALTALLVALAISCGGGYTSKQMSTTGMIQVSLSDPPSCTPPNGQFTHVFITVRSVQVHTSATAGDADPGWQEIAPQLATAPMQIDLF